MIDLTCDCCCDWWCFRASVNSKTPNKKSTHKGHSHCHCHHHHHHCACVSFYWCLLGGFFLGFPYGKRRFFLITEVKSFWIDSVDELNNWTKTIEDYSGLPSTSCPTTAILCPLSFNRTLSDSKLLLRVLRFFQLTQTMPARGLVWISRVWYRPHEFWEAFG